MGFLGDNGVPPWPGSPGLGGDLVDVPPPGGHVGIPWGIQKKEKNKRMFLYRFQRRFILFLDNPKFTTGNVWPTLRVWGVPTIFFIGMVLE